LNTLNEQNLVARLHSGDPTAFEDLYRQYSGYVAFICLKFCDNREDAEEAIQDTFLDVHNQVKTLRADTLRALIRRIAICKCYRKRNQSRQLSAIRVDVDLTAYEELNDDFLPEQYLHNKEQRAELLRIIMALPKMQWETVYLYYYASFSTEEIARLQNCSTGNVRKTLRNARASTKDKLEGKQKGKVLKPIAGFATVSLGAVLIAEEQVFAASYIPGAVVPTAVACTATTACTAITYTGTLAAVKGYAIAACITVAVVVSAATYYILWQDEPTTPSPVVAAVVAPLLAPEPPSPSPSPSPSPTLAPTTTPAPTPAPTPTPTTAPITTPAPTTAPETTAPPTSTPAPPPTTLAPTLPPTPAPTTAPAPVDNTQAILAALARAVSAQDVADIIAQFNFQYDQMIRGSNEVFRFYVTNEGSGDILVGTATDDNGNFLRMRYAFFNGDVMPQNVIELLNMME